MKNLMNWTAAGMMLTSVAALSPVSGASPNDKSEMAEFRQWKKDREQKEQNREEHRKKMHEKRMDRLSKELDLTSAQRKKISVIMEDSWKEVAKERKAFREKVTDIRAKSDKSIEKELTKEQIEKWGQCKREVMGKRRKSMKNRKDKRRSKDNRMNCEPSDRGGRWNDRD